MSTTVKAFARFRPTTDPSAPPAFLIDARGREVAAVQGGQRHSYDAVFPPAADNAQVYAEVAAPIVRSFVGGVNGCVMCYGQTGSGKTHTTFGTDADDGIVPRALRDVFDHAKTTRTSRVTRVAVSFVEVYNEGVYDLLSPGPPLEIRETQSGVTYTAGLTVRLCQSVAGALSVIAAGAANKTIGDSYVHSRSSRAHTVVVLHMASESRSTRDQAKQGGGASTSALATGDAGVLLSKLAFVDLAGSELLTAKFGEAQQAETKAINLSLLALRGVIDALAQRDAHVPYRDSALTRVLSGHLSRNASSAVIAACALEEAHATFTLGALRFGSIANEIEQRARLNTLMRSRRGPKLKAATDGEKVEVGKGKKSSDEKDAPVTFATPTVQRTTVDTPLGPLVCAVAEPAGDVKGVAVVLHAFGDGCGRDDWTELFPVMAGCGFRVVAPDFPGFGDSAGRRPSSRTDRLWGDDGVLTAVRAVIDSACRGRRLPLTLFGHDWGGNMALSLGLHQTYGPRVKSIALYHPSWTNPVDELHAIKCPVLLLWVPSDQLHLLSTGKRMVRLIKKATLVQLVTAVGAGYNGVHVALREKFTAWFLTHHKPSAPVAPSPPPAVADAGSSSSSSSDDGDSDAAEVDDDDDDLECMTQLSDASSFLACLVANPAVAEDAIEARHRQKQDLRRVRRALRIQEQAEQDRPVEGRSDAHTAALFLAWALQSPDRALELRQAVLRRCDPVTRSRMLTPLAALRCPPPFAAASWFVDNDLWASAPVGAEFLSNTPRYPAGRQVFVRCPAVPTFTSAAFGCYDPSAAPRVTHKAWVAAGGHTDTHCAIDVRTAANRSATTRVAVPWAELRRWNDGTAFRPTIGRGVKLLFEDAIVCRYGDDVTTSVKLASCAVAVAEIAASMDFAAAMAEIKANGGVASAPGANETGLGPRNTELLAKQKECVQAIRELMDTTHHVAVGRDLARLCVPDCGRLATYGQWHCHGMASVFASLLLPFSTALGIVVKYRDGFFYYPVGRDAEGSWDGAPRPLADHSWLEVTFLPSGTTFVTDPSFTHDGEDVLVPIDEAYTQHGRRFPVRDLTCALDNATTPQYGASSKWIPVKGAPATYNV